VVPSSAKFIAACDGHPRGWHGDPPAARRHMLRPQADACDVQFSTPELTLGALECSAAVARTPSYENERQTPPTGLYRYFIWYDIADRTAAYLSKAMKSGAIGIPERPLLALVQVATQVCRGHRSRFKASEADDSMPQRDRSLALSFSSRFGFRLIKFDTTALGQHAAVSRVHRQLRSLMRRSAVHCNRFAFDRAEPRFPTALKANPMSH